MTTTTSTAAPQGLNSDPCLAVPQLRNAIFMLASGASVNEVREKESWIRFMSGGAASLPQLRRLLYEAELACEDCRYRHGRAIRMGPTVNRLFDAPYGHRRFF